MAFPGQVEKWRELANKVFAGSGIPVDLVLAIIQGESAGDERRVYKAARGLMQITPVVWKDQVDRFGAPITTDAQLFDPQTNLQLGRKTLQHVVTVLRRYVQPNWDDRVWVESVIAGWNAGYSDKQGLGRVYQYLRQRGRPLNVDEAAKVAVDAGAKRYLSEPRRRRFWRIVAGHYFTGRGQEMPAPDPPPVALPAKPSTPGRTDGQGGTNTLGAGWLVLVAGLGAAWHYSRKKR